MTHVIVMAGGTGGHVFPALAAAKELIRRGYTVSWLGAPDSFESRTVPGHGIELDMVSIKGLRGNGIMRLLGAPVALIRSLSQSISIIRRRKPSLVVGMGGFASGPGGVAARLMGVPLVIHEQNAVPGLTNRLLSKVATRVCAAFPGAFPGNSSVEVTGNPVRSEITAIADPASRLAGREDALHLLVVGGSLGAAALNEIVPAALALLVREVRPAVRHQAGRDKDVGTIEAYRTAAVDAEVTAFIDDMAGAFSWADVVICRAGALTVSELAAAGVPAVLVPYPYAVDDHQTANGGYLADGGAAIMVQQSELSAEKLAQILGGFDREKLRQMALNARSLALPEATERVVDICEEVMKR